MQISIIGAGTTGQATGIGLGKHGNEVLFYDIDRKKLVELKRNGHKVASKILETVDESDIIFICVHTPTVNGQMDLTCLERAIINVSKVLSKAKKYNVVTVRSTVLPSTTRCRVIPLLERYSKLRVGEDFGVCMNPEFLREQYALEVFKTKSTNSFVNP